MLPRARSVSLWCEPDDLPDQIRSTIFRKPSLGIALCTLYDIIEPSCTRVKTKLKENPAVLTVCPKACVICRGHRSHKRGMGPVWSIKLLERALRSSPLQPMLPLLAPAELAERSWAV